MAVLKMVRLDYYIMKSVLKSFVIAALFVFSLFFLNTSVSLLLVNLAWYIALMSQNIFALEEKHKLERLYGILTLQKKHILLGRYLSTLFTYFSAVIVGLTLVSILSQVFYPIELSAKELFYALSMSFLIFSSIISLQFPIFFKFGHGKGKFYSMIPFVIVIGLASLFFLVGDASQLYSWVLLHPNISALLGFAFSCGLLAMSYGIALMFIRK